ncbi:hypothetical protein [Sandaracinus amylolyticus]|uniref:Cytochrome P460 domain-containing protein n=1 Tax=Sandaracinus amylolyticus TaxID=927083 RepID=A0A0F6W9E0_9BACT|nr:hypothetical protein [Sandaracinus amylolyticus]AKF10702.1 hypothetical protein DB32_007851 [Sandaracinus amylolyticus]
MRSAFASLVVVLVAAALTGALVSVASTVEMPAVASAPSDAGVDAGSGPFVAFARDFAGFRRWERIAVEGAMVPIGAPEGPTYVYASGRAPEGASRWPVGTILVKSIEVGPPSAWTIHAMVKRGVPYNRAGTIGWEFFELRFPEGEEDAPVIVWRGPGPPSGHGYAAMHRDAGTEPVALVCNDCHAAAWQSDGAITPALSLR